MADDLRVGIIGAGNISSAYLRLAPLFRGIRMVAVADLVPAVAQSRADEFDVAAMTVDGLLESGDIDVVVNLTIPAAHYEVSARAVDAGKHVYSEKPFVLSVDDGLDLAERAKAKDVRVGSAPDTFLGGAHQRARALIDEGAIGRVVGGTAHVMSRGMEHWHPNPDFFFKAGAGPILDVGPYYVTNLLQLLGPVTRVAGFATSASLTRTITSEPRAGETIDVETPTTVHAVLDFASGAVVTLGGSWDVRAHRHGPMELYGANGSLFLPDPNFFGGTVEIADAEGAVTEAEGWDHPFGIANDDGRANYRAAGLADMALAIQEGRAHRANHDLALHAVEVMTACLTAAETGAVQDLRTTCERPDALGPDAARALLR